MSHTSLADAGLVPVFGIAHPYDFITVSGTRRVPVSEGEDNIGLLIEGKKKDV